MSLAALSGRYWWHIISADILFAGTLLALIVPSSASAIIGSATALLVAFVAYPWQKAKDRELQMLSEERIAYKEMFSSMARLYGAIQQKDIAEADKEMHVSKAAFNNLVLYSSGDGITAVRTAIDKLVTLWALARKELGSPPDNNKWSPVFFKAMNEYRDADKDALLSARKSIRVLYDDDGAVSGSIYKDFAIIVGENRSSTK